MASFKGAMSRLVGSKAARAVDPPGLPEPYKRPVTWLSPSMVHDFTIDQLWQTQPYLRTVVTFRARNTAQCALQVYNRRSDTNRVRNNTGVAAKLLSNPNPDMTQYELVYALIADLDLYDHAYWYVTQDLESESGWRITRIPPSWIVGVLRDSLFAPTAFYIQPPDATQFVELPAANFIYFHGYNPRDPIYGSSAVDTLKEILAEQQASQEFRNQIMERGNRVQGHYLTPVEGVELSPEAKKRWIADMQALYSGSGPRAGGSPVLPEGITYQASQLGIGGEEQVAIAKLALDTVCQAFHTVPALLTGDGNYSNIKVFRQMLYGDTLGPLMAQIEDRINTFLLPMIGATNTTYVEFNIQEKMQGSFEEQASAIQTAVGAPVMTRAEARALLNLPELDADQNADKLIVPLNVIAGGQASPTDSAPAPADRTGPGDSQPEQQPKSDAVVAFLDHQQRAIVSRFGAGKSLDEAWSTHWDDTLAAIVGDTDEAKRFNDETKTLLASAKDPALVFEKRKSDAATR